MCNKQANSVDHIRSGSEALIKNTKSCQMEKEQVSDIQQRSNGTVC